MVLPVESFMVPEMIRIQVKTQEIVSKQTNEQTDTHPTDLLVLLRVFLLFCSSERDTMVRGKLKRNSVLEKIVAEGEPAELHDSGWPDQEVERACVIVTENTEQMRSGVRL